MVWQQDLVEFVLGRVIRGLQALLVLDELLLHEKVVLDTLQLEETQPVPQESQ